MRSTFGVSPFDLAIDMLFPLFSPGFALPEAGAYISALKSLDAKRPAQTDAGAAVGF
jgi:hypothetical protein